jgi:hypothetical protein
MNSTLSSIARPWLGGLAAACLLLAGCSGQDAAQQAEIARLRADVDRQQKTIAFLVERLDRTYNWTTNLHAQQTNMLGILGEVALNAEQSNREHLHLFDLISERIDALAARTNYVVVSKLPPPYAGTPRIRTAPEAKAEPVDPLRDGVPPHVFARIQQEAAKEWPNNYAMQSYEVKRQVAAWKRLNP